jgi:fumarate hydratase class II
VSEYRVERDTLGEVNVPRGAYWGAQTQRAVQNFPVSGLNLPPSFVRAQAVVKRSAAKAHVELGVLDGEVGGALVAAAEEVMAGRWHEEFVVDVFQAGAGTSQNMNVNEVLANRAEEMLGGKLGEYAKVHPNDHANMGQSTNDTFHAALHISAFLALREHLLPAAAALAASLDEKAGEFDDVVKCGRTHLQDAVPMRLGQEFGAYAATVREGAGRVAAAAEELRELCLGGTAVGTGLNAAPGYKRLVFKYVNEATDGAFRPAASVFAGMQSLGAAVAVSGALRALATGLVKVADDFRLLSSGPRAGLRELKLPAVQPGSSIMPGKVNPVMAEMLDMVCFQVFGCDAAIVHAARAGQLELNVMMPVVAYNFLFAIDILARAMTAFAERCVEGVEADEEICRRYAEESPALATALSPYVGYRKAAELAQRALRENKSVRELAAEEGILDDTRLEELLDARKMTLNPDDRTKTKRKPKG